MDAVTIVRWQPQYRQQVIDLILPIQTAEFGIAISAEQQPDLQQVDSFYQQGAGQFWLAMAGEQVVGCIALKDIGERQAALRKMFVAAGWRGRERGVAHQLLHHLLAHAQQQQLASVWLGTTAAFLAAHRFYEKQGFSLVDAAELPAAFPRMQVDSRFYCKML